MGRISGYVLDIRIWDVAHGSATYMRAGNKDVVLDCGASSQFSPLKWLSTSYFGLNSIDYLIISHPHQDHIEDLDVMRDEGLKSDSIILQRPKKATGLVEENLEEARERGKEDFVEDAEYYLEVLDPIDGTPDIFPYEPKWALDANNLGKARTDGGVPRRGVTFHHYSAGGMVGNDNYEKLNNLSRVTVVNSFGFTFVSTGDLLPAGIEEIKDDSQAMSAVKNADVLVAPHHGRDTSFDREFVEHVNPDLVVFSDKGGVDNTASSEYSGIANGVKVEHENTGNIGERNVVTTRQDGRIRIQANNDDDWNVSIYGRDYANAKSSTRRYQGAD